MGTHERILSSVICMFYANRTVCENFNQITSEWFLEDPPLELELLITKLKDHGFVFDLIPIWQMRFSKWWINH